MKGASKLLLAIMLFYGLAGIAWWRFKLDYTLTGIPSLPDLTVTWQTFDLAVILILGLGAFLIWENETSGLPGKGQGG